MTDVKQIINLVKKDILLEVRQQYTFYGIILYVASTIFVIYLTMGQPEEQIWNGLFWIVQLFICTNAVAKSFLSESKGRMLYFYTIAGARVFILSKLFFNLMLMLVMSLLSLIIFTLLLNNPLHKCPGTELNRYGHCWPQDFKSCVSTNSTTRAT
jgi:heme exporter protein B